MIIGADKTDQMTLIYPRLTDHFGIDLAQADVDFAIPFLDADIPLYVDPFLLWNSPSQQDQALHTAVINSFNHLGRLVDRGRADDARRILIGASECAEIGLGQSRKRRGNRIGTGTADEILALFQNIDHYKTHGFTHFEEIQLFVDGIAKDRISDICCSFLKSFLIDYTVQECEKLGIPMQAVSVDGVFDYRNQDIVRRENVFLPVVPGTEANIILVPKRWLRFSPWIGFDEYFRAYCPSDEIFNPGEPRERVKVLTYNRQNYGVVKQYIEAKERDRNDCANDPLFSQIPITSAKNKLTEIRALPTGKDGNADKRYEQLVVQLFASLFYPHLDFAGEQLRTESGAQIRDLIFYNNRKIDFLSEIHNDYGSRQIVFEIKNVAEIDRDHVNQLNRYLDAGLGRFGVFATRNPLKRAMEKNIIDLWSGQRRCILVVTDSDVELMVNVFESRQRSPIEVLKRIYVDFCRRRPS